VALQLRERCCLIPVTEFAEESEAGSKTRIWFAFPDQPVFAVAGIWRDTDEWGPVYSIVMAEACIHVERVHDRMPVILRPDDWIRWTDAPSEDVRALCVPYPGEMAINRTADAWMRRA
jgi:putative SOS response-associated peptidase YedK